MIWNPSQAQLKPQPDTGWQEIVLSVSNLERSKAFHRTVSGYEIAHEGPVDPAQIRQWGLNPEDTTATEAVFYNPGETRGVLRLVDFDGAEQVQIRSSGRPYDTGGWFDYGVRTPDMAQSFRAAQDAGFQAHHDPVSFTFGRFEVTEVLLRGFDSETVAMIQRHAPKLEGWPNMRKWSRPFNAVVVVRDMDASLAFWRDMLGFKTYMETKGPSRTEGPNVLGLPYKLTDEISRHVIILSPQGDNEGSVELLHFQDMLGARDFSARASAPNLGLLEARFAVSNAQSKHKDLEKSGATILSALAEMSMPPYGEVSTFSVRGPDGEMVVFFEILKVAR